VLAVEELFWLRRRGQLTRPALREMAMSLSTLPPNIVVSIVAGGGGSRSMPPPVNSLPGGCR
jgi:hypothetical protein